MNEARKERKVQRGARLRCRDFTAGAMTYDNGTVVDYKCASNVKDVTVESVRVQVPAAFRPIMAK
jgi:hypothetical protein